MDKAYMIKRARCIRRNEITKQSLSPLGIVSNEISNDSSNLLNNIYIGVVQPQLNL